MDNLPYVCISPSRKVSWNGTHNAFTDLCRFNDNLYLTFRSADKHGFDTTASVIVLRSGDQGMNWIEVNQFQVVDRDTRDPHFLVFKEKLFVYTGTWYGDDSASQTRDMNQDLGYAVWTRDGTCWSEPQMLEGTLGNNIWRAATDGKRAYISSYRKRSSNEQNSKEQHNLVYQSNLLGSEDGLKWEDLALVQAVEGHEIAFLFEPDGSILGIARRGSDLIAEICRSKPPFDQFSTKDLDRYIGGPLIADWDGLILVGGRKKESWKLEDGRKKAEGPPKTALYWLNDDALVEFAELPSGGDNSYPGFVDLGQGRALVSYYSSHEKDDFGKPITAIYLAELQKRE